MQYQEPSIVGADIFPRSGAASYRPGVLTAIANAIGGMNLPLRGRVYIRQALEAPSRATGSGRKNLTGRYPSKHMGVTIQFESGTLELPAIHGLEHACGGSTSGVVAYCDQPPKIQLTYKSDISTKSYQVTPDFLVVYKDRIVLVECKPATVLRERAQRDPALFARDDEGKWACPPAQAAASEMGFEHEVWSEEQFPPVRMSNIRLLDDYFGELLQDDAALCRQEALVELVGSNRAITVSDLLATGAGRFEIDHVYRAIARGQVVFDIDRQRLDTPSKTYLFRDAETAEAFRLSDECITRASNWRGPTSLELTAGSTVLWDGVPRDVLHVGETNIHFKSGDGDVLTLDRRVVRQMLDSGTLKPYQAQASASTARLREAYEFLAKCRAEDLKVANLRLNRIAAIVAGVAPAPQCRTLRRYVAQYKKAEQAYGNGFLGLVPRFWACGNRQARTQADALELALAIIHEKYLDERNVRIKRVHDEIKLACEELGLSIPSYSWVCGYIKKLSKHVVTKARAGDKAAYGSAPRDSEDPAIATMAEPARPFERAHIDHTQSDVEAIFEDTGENLGRPWLTVMIDHHSRKILGFCLTYDPPSYRSVLMTIRDCVRRHGRLPSEIVVDGGKEFRSVWFEVACALFKVAIIRRPPRKGRHGSQIERFFGTINSMLLHVLRGNTQLRKNVRQMTPAVDPSKSAVWTLATLYDQCEEFLFDVYEDMVHAGILMTPRNAFQIGMRKHGARVERALAYDRDFLIMTCPSTKKGTAKVQPDGVKINHFYYNAPGLSMLAGRSLPVRYEPYDLSIAYVQIDREWQRVTSRFDRQLRGLGERELELITNEYTTRYGKTATARLNDTRLAKFLREVEAKELLLVERRRALELQRLLGYSAEHRGNEAAPAQMDQVQHQAAPSAEPHDAGTPASGDCTPDVEIMDMDTYQ